MAKRREQAFAAISRLPAAEQDSVAQRLLDDLEAEETWDRTFASSADKLAQLGRQAIDEFRYGQTSPMNDEARDLSHD